MVFIVNHILKQAMSFSKQAIVLNYQTIFQANNGFELLNHVSSKHIFYKTGLTKIPSLSKHTSQRYFVRMRWC